jgi:hypothetical protein
MDGSWLARAKQTLISLSPFPAEVWFVLAGLGCYLATCAIARRPLTWVWALVPGLCLSLAIEGWEIWDHWGGREVALRGQLAGILARHLKDVALMNLPPAAVVAFMHWR